MRGQDGKSEIIIGEYVLKEDILKAICSITSEAAVERDKCIDCKDHTCGNQSAGVAESDGQLTAALRISARLGIELTDIVKAIPKEVRFP